MSPKNPVLAAGLTALGVLGMVAAGAAAPDGPPVPQGPPPAQAPSAPPTVLLKSNGQILRGVITEETDHYVVRQSAGEIRVPKSQAEGTFASMDALYRYKLSSVPARDPDEYLKLARWCLGQNLKAEAIAALRTVVTLSPDARDAKAMLASLEAAEARLSARPQADPGLVQTGGERVEGTAGAIEPNAPAELDAVALRKLQRVIGAKGLPVIFDLPPALAVKRADEFARAVHPVLQAACAGCHNEKHDGTFQLIEVKPRRAPTADVLRANLDATLRLVDPENPARSELLSSALLPHGNAPTKRPIFRGSNDMRFQILATWVNNLRPHPAAGRTADGVVPARFGGDPAPAAGRSGFAVDRGAAPMGASVSPAPLANPVRPYPLNARPEVLPAQRYVPGRGLVPETTPPAPDEFPAPYMLGGPAPKRNAATPSIPAPVIPMPGQPTAAGAAPGPTLPALPPGMPPDDPAAPRPDELKKTSKPVKIDPALLEKALMNRNAR